MEEYLKDLWKKAQLEKEEYRWDITNVERNNVTCKIMSIIRSKWDNK